MMDPLRLGALRPGMCREEVVSILGEPDRKGVTSRKYKTPCVFRYGRIEVLFEPWKSGGLTIVQEIDELGNHLRTLNPV